MGTMNSSAFDDKIRTDGKRSILFNGPGDGANKGHVVIDDTGTVIFARDVEGEVYVDDSKD